MRTSFKYLIALLFGLLIMPYAMRAAYIQRGYFAIGGELLIPLLLILMITLSEQFSPKLLDKERHKKSTHQSAQTKIISLN